MKIPRLLTASAAGLLLGGLGIATSRADILYVSNDVDETIEKITPGGVRSVFASTGFGQARGLAFDSAGNLYAAYYATSTIEKFTPGGVGTAFASTGAVNPIALAFDSVGNLYTTNYGDGTIERFTPGGVGSHFANANAGYPDGMAFTDNAGVPLLLPPTVPEPSACASLALGVTALLALRRRRG